MSKKNFIFFLINYPQTHYLHFLLIFVLKFYFASQGFGSGSAWIRINLSCWIRIRIRIQIADPDPDPGGKNDPKK
jgi:hypothetical protein